MVYYHKNYIGYNKELQIPVIVKMMDIQNFEIDKIIRAIQGSI